ncbi:hypothetical protein MLD38_029333 [Melastoma candidum]|uniref:Uncharacterized protein n=1 Tax=Melastoma candidum TaxID=119954 RepID=A0ACB9N5K5_9MYRT|nr:hypothetical protein MLD38_029333 [Melastoma candidum]
MPNRDHDKSNVSWMEEFKLQAIKAFKGDIFSRSDPNIVRNQVYVTISYISHPTGGNTENKSMNKVYGFEGEDRVDGVKLSDIRLIDWFCEPPEQGLMCEILWSDPHSHCLGEAPASVHEGKLITVFSAPNYCDQIGNKGAFVRFKAPDMKPDIVTFSAATEGLSLKYRETFRPPQERKQYGSRT